LTKEGSMSEFDKAGSTDESDVPAVPPAGAGALLRQAREAQGLELDQLAQLLKVPVRKLAALESERFEELPGNAFVRGLAMSVARQLGLDPQAVLAALPQSVPAPAALESVSRGLATPYREPDGRVQVGGWPEWLRPGVLAPAILLIGALLLWFAPPMRTLFSAVGSGVATSAQEAASQAGALSASSVELVAQAASAVPGVASAAAAAMAASAPQAASSGAAGMASAVVDTVHSAPQARVAAGATESWVVRDAWGATRRCVCTIDDQHRHGGRHRHRHPVQGAGCLCVPAASWWGTRASPSTHPKRWPLQCRAEAHPRAARPHGHAVPLVGDFHYNGHRLLTDFPAWRRHCPSTASTPATSARATSATVSSAR
jgi:cytoskeleton protein RodZ